MFDGAENNNIQNSHSHHHLIASNNPLLPPLNFHAASAAAAAAAPAAFAVFDGGRYSYRGPEPEEPHGQRLLLHHQLHLHHHHRPAAATAALASKDKEKERGGGGGGIFPASADPWSNDEVVVLLKIGTTMENWFPDCTWEHVSRKLAEVGFKRSPEKCKEKFEEEIRCFNSSNCIKNDHSFLTSGLEQLYNHNGNGLADHGANQGQQKNEKLDNGNAESQYLKQPDFVQAHQEMEGNLSPNLRGTCSKKRTRDKGFETLKVFCEDVVRMIIAQQEDMHKKLLEGIVKRDEEKLAREEEWKKQEMERFNREVEIKAQGQAIAGNRQAVIIELLKKFTSSSNYATQKQYSQNVEDLSTPKPKSHASSLIIAQDQLKAPTSYSMVMASQNCSSYIAQNEIAVASPFAQNPNGGNGSSPPNSHTGGAKVVSSDNKACSSNIGREELGKRWPRDEVLSLISLRCSLYSSTSGEENKDETKAPLWERVSQKMQELGYTRSAKRCKEKWENINKYYRKTKDNVQKKRSLGSRTCPYFHQLSALYGEGKPGDIVESHLLSQENRSEKLESSQVGPAS